MKTQLQRWKKSAFECHQAIRMAEGVVALQVGGAGVKIQVDGLARSANSDWTQPLTVVLLSEAADGTSFFGTYQHGQVEPGEKGGETNGDSQGPSSSLAEDSTRWAYLAMALAFAEGP